MDYIKARLGGMYQGLYIKEEKKRRAGPRTVYRAEGLGGRVVTKDCL